MHEYIAPVIALGLYLCLSLVLVVSHGHYGAGPVVMVVAVGLVLVGARKLSREERRLDAAVLLGCSLANLAILTAGTQMIYAREAEPLKVLRNMLFVTAFTVALALVAQRQPHRYLKWASVALAAVALVAMLVGKAMVIRASPQPFIDVWTSSVAAVDHLLAGRNPYTQQYVDIYAGSYNYKPGMPYGPSFLLWSALWAKLFGGQHDVRVGLFVAEVLLAVGLGALVWRRSRDLLMALGLALLWATNPIALFVLEQSWVDPLLMVALVGCLLALHERRLALAGGALGFAFTVKTYAIVAVGLIGLWVIANHGLKGSKRFIIGAAATTAAFLVPFIAMDPGAFWNSMFGLWANQAPRADALTLTALRGELEGLQGHEALRPIYGPFNIATLVLSATAAWWMFKRAGPSAARLAWGLAAVHVWFFLFARQAFCNYYYYALLFPALVLASMPTRAPVEQPGTRSEAETELR